jgi:GT2 family glycosyltransferase
VTTPELSVVVPTYRRPGLLGRCLDALAGQDVTGDRFEVVVADDGSGDDTAAVVRAAARRSGNVRLEVLEVNRGPAAARNRALQAAQAPLVLFLDDDVEASPTLVSTHLAGHASAQDERLGILGLVRWAPHLTVTPFMRWLDRSGLQFAYDTWLQPGPVPVPHAAFYTANLSMRRDLVLAVGGFDETFPYASFEDIELAWRLGEHGFHLEYRPEALAFHARPIDLATFRRRTANDAESAALAKRLQPGLDIDESGREHGFIRRRRRLAMTAMVWPAERLGRDGFLSRYYQAEIAAAYRAGQRRAAR